MGVNQFAKAWDHTLRLRDLFATAPGLPAAAETLAISQAVVERIKALQSKLQPDDALLHDLDLVVENFDDLEGIENDYEARDRFNQCMALLYDEADHGKRVWIE